MDIRRLVLYMALALVTLSLWNAWQIDYPHPQVAQQTPESSVNNAQLLPQVNNSNAVPHQEPVIANENEHGTTNSEHLIQVKTDVLDLAIDLNQGNVVSSDLLDYPLSVDEKNKPFLIPGFSRI